MSNNFFSKFRGSLPARPAALAIVIIFAILFVFSFFTGPKTVARLEAVTQKIVEECKRGNESPDHCYEREVPKLYGKLSVGEIFEVIHTIRVKDPSYQFCHVLAHLIGERVVAEDKSRWVEAISLNPSGNLCSNGFIHGVIGGRFRADVLDDKTLENLIPDFSRACEPRRGWNPTPLDQAVCYHGMGHLYDFITAANLPQALSLCERTTFSKTRDFRRVCMEGVFMQIYQPLEPDDFILIENMSVKPATTTIRSFCSVFADDEYEGACLRESWPFFREGILNGTGAKVFCSDQPNRAEETKCFETISAIVGRMSLGNPSKAINACNNFPKERQEICYAISAQAVLEEDSDYSDKAISLCKSAPGDIANSCIQTLYSRTQFIFGSNKEAHNRFCQALPSPTKEECISSR